MVSKHAKPISANNAKAHARPAGAETSASVSFRDRQGSRIARRLNHFNPRALHKSPVSTRIELMSASDDPWRHQLHWRALLAAAQPSNPGLDPQSLHACLEDASVEIELSFLLIWRQADSGPVRQCDELIGLVPLIPEKIARMTLPWWSSWTPRWWPVASPLVHRRHPLAVANAILKWLRDDHAPAGGLVLKDIARAGPFTDALLAHRHITFSAHGRTQPILPIESHMGMAQIAPGSAVAIKGYPELVSNELDACLSLNAVWTGDIGPNGIVSPQSISAAHYDYLCKAASQGRLMLAETLINERVAAMALSLRTGATANVITLSASPRLGEHERTKAQTRALTGLINELGNQGQVASIEAQPSAHQQLAGRLSKRRELIDIFIPGRSSVGRVLIAANRLHHRLRRF